jgi:hypothetical protein
MWIHCWNTFPQQRIRLKKQCIQIRRFLGNAHTNVSVTMDR